LIGYFVAALARMVREPAFSFAQRKVEFCQGGNLPF